MIASIVWPMTERGDLVGKSDDRHLLFYLNMSMSHIDVIR